MAFTRKQLALIFAKLREKGLLRYIKKARRPEGSPSTLAGTLVPRLQLADVKRLLSRLPVDHRRWTKKAVRGVRFWEDKPIHGSRYTVASYDADTGVFNLSDRPHAYAMQAGSVEPLLFSAGGYAWKRPKKASAEAFARGMARNIRVGRVRSFYHEYGHAIWNSMGDEFNAAWFTLMQQKRGKEWRGLFSRMRLFGDEEAFADAYSFYASSKASKARLKRERPASYAFMDAFFQGKTDWDSLLAGTKKEKL